jgi:putative acetyltransferase
VVVLGHPEYYPKLGFQQAVPKGIITPFPVPDEVLMVKELKEDSLAEIKGMIRYPSSFDAVT